MSEADTGKQLSSRERGTVQALAQLDRTMRYARSRLGADITIQRLLILLNVYLHEGLSQKELLTQLDATSVTALSRNLADLSAWTTKKQPGPGLIELRADPMNLRRKTIHLTPTPSFPGRTTPKLNSSNSTLYK